MSDRKCARILVEAATRDAQIVRLGCRHSQVADEIFGFHVQQAVEKLLKAWLAILGELYPLTHDLHSLLDLLRDRNCRVGTFRALAGYQPFAVIHRYEALGPEGPPMERIEAARLVDLLLREVKDLLAPPEGD